MTAVLGEILTAAVTPFREDGAVDYERYRELCTYLVEHGSDGVVVAGTTGESPTLTDDERIELVRTAVDAIGDRATVIAGTGTYSTAHSMHLTELAHAAGAHGFLVVTPYYSKPPPRGIVEHFKAIASMSDRPIVVYNIPSRVVLNLEPATISELAEIPTRALREAGARRPRPGAAHRGQHRARSLRRRRQPDLPVPRAGRHRRRLRPHARLRAAGARSSSAAIARATSRARARWIASSSPPTTS